MGEAIGGARSQEPESRSQEDQGGIEHCGRESPPLVTSKSVISVDSDWDSRGSVTDY
jgi:hypothetical protein